MVQIANVNVILNNRLVMNENNKILYVFPRGGFGVRGCFGVGGPENPDFDRENRGGCPSSPIYPSLSKRLFEPL